jgi:hypothetical protein
MAQSLRSYHESERSKVANNRVLKATMGLGYWAAKDYLNHKSKKADAK